MVGEVTGGLVLWVSIGGSEVKGELSIRYTDEGGVDWITFRREV